MSEETRQLVEIFKKCDLEFKKALDEAVNNQRVRISEDIKAYLLWILLFGINKDPHDISETVITRYQNAFTGKGPETFRDIGDWALMLSGIWWASLARKLVDLDFYVDVGRMSYLKEAETNPDSDFSVLFEELSVNFLKSVNLLMEATHAIDKREKHQFSPAEIIEMYNNWLVTHSKLIRRKLNELGIEPVNLKSPKQ